jgi:hypothetical protein
VVVLIFILVFLSKTKQAVLFLAVCAGKPAKLAHRESREPGHGGDVFVDGQRAVIQNADLSTRGRAGDGGRRAPAAKLFL